VDVGFYMLDAAGRPYEAFAFARFDARGQGLAPNLGLRLDLARNWEFLARLVSQQEDYAPPAYGALMNLIDSHDTTRALWTLSPGSENDAAAKTVRPIWKIRLRPKRSPVAPDSIRSDARTNV